MRENRAPVQRRRVGHGVRIIKSLLSHRPEVLKRCAQRLGTNLVTIAWPHQYRTSKKLVLVDSVVT